MANGWDSYFHTLSTPSEKSPMSRTSESEGSFNQHIENFIGHHDFPGTGISHGSSATNSNFNTHYYSNSSFENPSSDCLFQRYGNETPWQADGEQMVKDYLPSCGNSEISDFATDGLSTQGSFATDLQDCGMLAKSLLEDYSDVSSCSDADVGEKRLSSKFMAGNSVSKPKNVTTNPSSSEWLFTDDTNVALASSSNVMAGETIVKDKMECRDKTVHSYTENNPSWITSNMVTTAVSMTVEENGGGPEQEQKEDINKDLIQGKSSNISTSNDEKFTDDELRYPDGNDKEQIAESVPNILTTLNNVQEKLRGTILRNKIEESEVLRGQSSLFENRAFDKKTTLNPNSTDSQDERIDCLEKEILLIPNSDHQVCSKPAMTSDGHFSKACDQIEQCIASHSDPSIQPTNSSTDSIPCLEKESTSAAENTNPPDPVFCTTSRLIDSNKNEQVVAANVESCLKPSSSNINMNPSVEIEFPPSLPGSSDRDLTGDRKEKSCGNGSLPGSQSNPLSTGATLLIEKELPSPAENTNATSPQSQQRSPEAVEQRSFNGDVVEKAESFKKLKTSAEEASLSGILYGEPTSIEDSSCDANESKLDRSPSPDTSLPGPDKGQAQKLMSSTQLRKSLQPVVVLRTSESANGTGNSYHCAICQQTTYSVHDLIEHHHCCHSVQNFQFCITCEVYRMVRNDQSEKHVCCLTKDGPRLSSDSSLLKQRKRCGSHRCIRCRLEFSKLNDYIRHIRSHTGKTPYRCNECGLYFAQSGSMQRHKKIPGRCRGSKVKNSNADSDIKETKRSPQDNSPLSKPCLNLPECYVKLVDISKTLPSSTAEKFKNHFHNKNKGKDPAASSSPHTIKHSEDKTPEVQSDILGKYKCPICPRLFKYSFNRARHLRDCVRSSMCEGKGKIAGKYPCPLCHVTFTLSSNRYRHVKSICLRECIIRLSKSRATSVEPLQQKTTKEIEQKTQSRKSEWKKRHGESAPALTPLQTVPRYKCTLCPAVFCHASGKYRHMKKHELFKLTGKLVRYRNSFSSMTKPATVCSTIAEENEATDCLVLGCRFCGKCFDTPQSLKKHLRSHRGEKPYRCLECGKVFKKRANLIGHKIVHRRRIQCTVCQKIFPTVGDLIQHRSAHLKRGMLQCPDCPLQFQYPAHLLRHVDSHKRRESRTSQHREKPFIKLQESLESVKEQTRPKHLECSLCKEVFDDAQLLRKHCLAHISGSSLNQCPFCEANFSNRRYLLRHMIKHTGDAPFSCANCGRQFYRSLYLKLHGETCLSAQTRHVTTIYSKKGPLVCFYCPRRFSRKNRLKNHHNGHKANTLLPCSRCGQCFGYTKLNHHQKNCTETSELNNGMSSVNGDVRESNSQARQDVPIMPQKSNATNMLPLKCPHCTKRFQYRSLLLRHIVSHTGIQPYACMHCGHGYRNQSTCLQHEAFCDGVHKERLSKVKGTAATQLSKTPTVSETAPKPMAEGEAVFKCKFCTKSFVKSRSLRRHILTHNEVKPYRCRACDCCYSRYDHLKVHQARCKGKKTRLEVCIPKISLDDIGRGWQNKSGRLAVNENHEPFKCNVCTSSFSAQSKLSRHVTMFHMTKRFKCTPCGSSFVHEGSLRKHRKRKRCRTPSKESNESPPLETENVTTPLKGVRNRLIQRIQPYLSKNYKYTCNYCPRAFQNAWQLVVHTRLHTGERPYACDDCGERFIRKDYVKRHSAKCTKERCIVTPSLSKSMVCQSKQSPTKSTPEGFSCAYCSSRFLLFSQLQEHFLNAHKPETNGPPMSSAPLQHHLSNIPNIKKEPLDESCENQFSDGATLINAGLESKVPTLLSCQDCNVSFANKAGLTSHLRVHSIGHPYNCVTCKRGFWNKWLLHNHKRKCRFGHIPKRSTTQQLHAPLKAEIDFVLNDSVLVFKEASELSGTGVLQTNFSCKDEVTDKSTDNSEGEQVQSSSSNEKKAVQYQCSECDKSFTDGLMLISHLEDHGRQDQAKKRNACVECGQVFANKGNLARHMKMHDDDGKFSCPECEKTFKNQSEVEIHQHSHDPNRPFSCRLCNQGFQKRQSLCDHYKEDHPDNMFTCCFCSKVYSVKKSLARHYRRWHRDEQRNFGTTSQEKSAAAQQSSSQISTTGESDEDRYTGSEGSDSDSAPYFPCHVCGKTFPTSEGLEDHQRCHLGEKPHECAECGKCFFQAAQLQQHERMHKSEYQCQACGRGFVTLFALRKHKHTHGKNRPYRCSKCDFSFAGPLKLAEHMSTHREENFPCDICNRVFLSKSSRVEHRKSHSKSNDCPHPLVLKEEHNMSEVSGVSPEELKYRCGVCSERFKDPEKLSEHGCMEAKERPHSCSDCNKHFLHASHLEKHRTTHHVSPPNSEYRCNQCNNSFSTSRDFLCHLKSHGVTAAELKQHTKATDVAQSNGFICPVCHLYFANAAELMGHFPTHSDGTFECQICKMTFPSRSKLDEHECHHVTCAKKFECKECDQKFGEKDDLKQHQETEHSNLSAKTSAPPHYQTVGEEEEIDVIGEDFFKCPVCSIEFSSKSALLEHQNKLHPNKKPFQCKLCGKNFARRRYLVLHEQRHLQPLTFKCTQCRSTFNTAKELSLHMRAHAEKEVGKFRCDMCYKSFSEWPDLKQHQESHVGQVVYECTECDKAFAFPHLLHEHQQTHAGSSL
ncbi:zinc finger protein 1035 isoform 1-T2 [Spinachia spinachia]